MLGIIRDQVLVRDLEVLRSEINDLQGRLRHIVGAIGESSERRMPNFVTPEGVLFGPRINTVEANRQALAWTRAYFDDTHRLIDDTATYAWDLARRLYRLRREGIMSSLQRSMDELGPSLRFLEGTIGTVPQVSDLRRGIQILTGGTSEIASDIERFIERPLARSVQRRTSVIASLAAAAVLAALYGAYAFIGNKDS